MIIVECIGDVVQLELKSPKCLRKIVAVLSSTVFTNWWTLMSIKPRCWKLLMVLSWIVPNAPNTNGTTSILLFHKLCNSMAKSKYFSAFSLCLSITCLSITQATSISFVHLVCLSINTTSGLLAVIHYYYYTTHPPH